MVSAELKLNVCNWLLNKQNVTEMYPDSTLGIEMWSSSRPTMGTTPTGLHGFFEGFVDFSIRLDDGSSPFLFSLIAVHNYILY